MNQKLFLINRFSRFTLAFVFFYQGLVPKIIWLDSTEILLVELHKLSFKTELVSMFGGFFELFLALFIVFYKKSLLPIYCSIIVFVALLIDVSIMQPSLLIKAFNPLTMNIMGIFIGVGVIVSELDNKHNQ